MTAVIETQDQVTIVSVKGRLDGAAAKPLEQQLQSVMDSGCQALLIDLGQLDYISSSGLRILLVAAKRLKNRLALSGLHPHVREIFELSGFVKIFTIHPDRNAALAGLTGGT